MSEFLEGIRRRAAAANRTIVMPEGTANLCFVGAHRNRLFMTSSQSVYTLYPAAQGAHIT